MRRRWERLAGWLDHRTGIQTLVRNFLYEEIPASSGWKQVFGSVAVFLFLTQAFTGILLAFNYAPTPGEAYNSVRYILTELTGGRLIRGLHHWGASMMIAVVVLHMTQVFLFGAYKKPREATWILGVALFLLTLAYGLTGYLLPWDNRAYWGTVVVTQIAAQAPLLGPYLTRLLGGEGEANPAGSPRRVAGRDRARVLGFAVSRVRPAGFPQTCPLDSRAIACAKAAISVLSRLRRIVGQRRLAPVLRWCREEMTNDVATRKNRGR